MNYVTWRPTCLNQIKLPERWNVVIINNRFVIRMDCYQSRQDSNDGKYIRYCAWIDGIKCVVGANRWYSHTWLLIMILNRCQIKADWKAALNMFCFALLYRNLFGITGQTVGLFRADLRGSRRGDRRPWEPDVRERALHPFRPPSSSRHQLDQRRSVSTFHFMTIWIT